jgi:hypothetical protein
MPTREKADQEANEAKPHNNQSENEKRKVRGRSIRGSLHPTSPGK